jgi:hypothetical protein
MTLLRYFFSALCWWVAAVLVSAAERVKPKPQRFVIDGVKAVPIDSLPKEEIFAPPGEWVHGLALYKRFHTEEGRA